MYYESILLAEKLLLIAFMVLSVIGMGSLLYVFNKYR